MTFSEAKIIMQDKNLEELWGNILSTVPNVMGAGVGPDSEPTIIISILQGTKFDTDLIPSSILLTDGRIVKVRCEYRPQALMQ